MPMAGYAAVCRRRAGRGPERTGEEEQPPGGARETPAITSRGGRDRAAVCGAAGWNVSCPDARPRRGARPPPTWSPPAPGGCAAAPSPPARAGGAGAGLAARVSGGSGTLAGACGVRSARGTCKTGPGDRITARSRIFCSSRMLPGQGYWRNACMVSAGMVSMVLCMRRAYCWAKWRTSSGISSRRSRRGGAWTGSRRPDRTGRHGTSAPPPSQADPGSWPRSAGHRCAACASCPGAQTPVLARRAGAWAAPRAGCSPISSRKIVPWLASSKRPMRWVTAPIDRPFLVPEELTREQSRGNSRATQLHEGVWTPRAQVGESHAQ